MIDWFTHKIKSINTVLDIGIILTVVTSFLTILIYAYKVTLLNIIGIPLSISINIIDVKIIDYIISLPIIFLVFLFGLISYYTLYIKPIGKKIRNYFIFLFGSILLGILSAKLNIFTSIEVSSMLVWLSFSYFLSPFFISFLLKRPTDIISKIFLSKNEKNKFAVFITEAFSIFLVVICITLYLANIRVGLPTKITLADNQIVIYSSQDALLVSDYKINSESTSTIKEVHINYDTLKITNKEKNYTVTKDKYLIK